MLISGQNLLLAVSVSFCNFTFEIQSKSSAKVFYVSD